MGKVQMKVVLPWLVRWACGAGTRDFISPLATLVQHILFLPVNYFNIFVPFAQQHGSQSCWVACLSWVLPATVSGIFYTYVPAFSCVEIPGSNLSL
jgi:hypothetical protein